MAATAWFALALGDARAADDLASMLSLLEEEWAEIFYRTPRDRQPEEFEKLLQRARAVAAQNPEQAEPLVLEAIVLCTYAGSEGGFGALRKVKQARELLIKAIAINPRAMDGAAYITLGNLYSRLPGWPISYGNNEAARRYLETALFLYPNAPDTNYFYGDFLLRQGEYDKALSYLEKADRAPLRPRMQRSDIRLKQEIEQTLQAARENQSGHSNFFSRLLPTFLR